VYALSLCSRTELFRQAESSDYFPAGTENDLSFSTLVQTLLTRSIGYVCVRPRSEVG